MKKILSIIVPSYKTAAYIEECLVPYTSPTLHELIKVLLIDDGTPEEKTPELLKKFVKSFPDIFQYFRKENGGHGSVINYGIKLVDTPYFMVVDGDDKIDPDSLKKAISVLDKQSCDLLISDFMEVNIKKNTKKAIFGYTKENPEKHEGLFRHNDIPSFRIFIQTTIWKTSIWQNSPLKVREHVFYEDREYCLYPLKYIQTIQYCHECIYLYRLGSEEQSVSAKSLSAHSRDHFLVMSDLLDYAASLKEEDPILYQYVCQSTVCLFYNQLISAMYNKESTKEQTKEKKRYLIDLYQRIVKNSDLKKYLPKTWLVKAAVLLHFHCLGFLWNLFRLLSKIKHFLIR